MSRINYIIIALSVVTLIIGFVLMSGGKTVAEFNPEVFSFRRITLAPIVCLIGFVMVIVGIMYRPKK